MSGRCPGYSVLRRRTIYVQDVLHGASCRVLNRMRRRDGPHFRIGKLPCLHGRGQERREGHLDSHPSVGNRHGTRPDGPLHQKVRLGKDSPLTHSLGRDTLRRRDIFLARKKHHALDQESGDIRHHPLLQGIPVLYDQPVVLQ